MTTYRDTDVETGSAPRRTRTVERDTWRPAVGPGMVLGLLAGAGVIVSCFLTWRDPSVRPDDVPIAFLFDDNTGAHHPSLLLALIPFAALLVIGALVPRGGPLRFLGGLGTLVVAGLFAYQTDRLLGPDGDLGSVLEVGFYVAALAGILGLVSGLVRGAWSHRRVVDADEDPDLWSRRR
jgi:hypothetical protein